MKSFTLLALSSLALASPHGKRHPHVPFGTGSRGSNLPKPTGGFYPGGPGNGTFPGANSTGAGSSGWANIPVLSTTVAPAPETPEVTAKPEGGFDKPDTSENVADLVAGEGAGDDAACSVVTQTETSIQYVTITAGSEGKPSANPATPETGSDEEKDSVSLTGVAQPSAGQFFGRPTGGFGGQNSYPSSGSEGAAAQPSGGLSVPSGTGSGSIPEVSTPVTGGSGSSSGNGSSSGSIPSAGGKLGVSYNDASLVSAFSGAATWVYNWAAKPDGSLPSGVEFVPMCWGQKDAAACATNAAGAAHVLSFNEPDHTEQANLSPEAAAQLHIETLNPLGQAGSKISTPAVTNGPAPMGSAWLSNWFDACAGKCTADFAAAHWYGEANNLQSFQQHVSDIIDVAAKNGVNEVWITEFGTVSGDEASFMAEATAWLDSQPAVTRYAAFMAAEGKLISGGSLNAIGKAYVGSA